MAQLVVFLQYGVDLPDVQTFGRQDPYAVLQVGAQKLTSVICSDGGRKPVWNEELRFAKVNPTDTLHITVMDKNSMGTDELIGTATVRLDQMSQLGRQDVAAPLISKANRSRGTIHMTLTWLGAAAGPGALPGQHALGALPGPAVPGGVYSTLQHPPAGAAAYPGQPGYSAQPVAQKGAAYGTVQPGYPSQQPGAAGAYPKPAGALPQPPAHAVSPYAPAAASPYAPAAGPGIYPPQPQYAPVPGQAPHPQQAGYPPQQQGGYPPQQAAYPQQQPGHSPQQAAYPPQQAAYPPQQQAGYPPQQQPGSAPYPPQQQAAYPPQQQAAYPPQQQAGHAPAQGGVWGR